MDTCEHCDCEIERSALRCIHCYRPGRFPNVMDASDENAVLQARYEDAVAKAKDAGLDSLRAKLEDRAESGHVVITKPLKKVDQISEADHLILFTYYEFLATGQIRDDEWDAPRKQADNALFKHYSDEIHFACLSNDGTGLPNYGDKDGAAYIQLREGFVVHRTSFLEENAVTFMEKHSGAYTTDAKSPPGHRSTWENRGKLAVAKLADRLTPGMNAGDIDRLLLNPNNDRKKDEFIEAHILGSITRRTICQVIYVGKRKKKNKEKAAILKGMRNRLTQVGVVVRGSS